MDDPKPANEPNEPGLNKIDLSQLQDFTFGTQWTEVKNTPGGPRRDPGDRRDRRDEGGRGPGGGGGPRDRRGFRKPVGAPAGGGGEGGGRPQDHERGERPRGEGFRGGPRRDFRGGGDRRDFRGGDRRDGPPMERGPYISPHFTMTCYPEDAGFAAMVKAVRASCRTFQLFEITKAVLEKNERFVVVIQRKHDRAERPAPAAAEGGEAGTGGEAARPSKSNPLFMSVPDHLPFETEEAAIHHVMANHLPMFFSTEEVEIDPPKGNFPIINKCGVTGELLGPPNYHRYQQILQQHHAARLGRMSFDRFRDSIQSVREPEVVQQWLDKMKKTTRYTWVFGQRPAAAKPAGTESAAPIEAPAPAEAGTAAPEVAAEAAPAPQAPEAPVPPETSEAPAGEPAAPEPVAAETKPAEAPVPAVGGPSFDSFDEARAHLLSQAKERVVRAVETVRFHGRLIEKLPPGEIRRAVEGHVERQRRFPLDTANALRGRLRREGFTIFKKGSRGVSYVCAVKRRFRVPGQVFSESITALIDFIEKHPMIHVKDLPKEMLGIDVAAAVAAAPLPESMPASQAPFAVLPSDQADTLRKLTNDLRWLVTEGYVTEFSEGKLFAPPPMTPQAGKKHDEHGEEHDPSDYPEGASPAAPAAAPESAESASGESTASEESPASDSTESAPPAASEPAPGGEAPAEDQAPAETRKPEGSA